MTLQTKALSIFFTLVFSVTGTITFAQQLIKEPAGGMDENEMSDEDVSLEEEFDPIGSASDLMNIVFIFDNELEAETFMSLNHKEIQYKKVSGSVGKIWQVNLSTTYGIK